MPTTQTGPPTGQSQTLELLDPAPLFSVAAQQEHRESEALGVRAASLDESSLSWVMQGWHQTPWWWDAKHITLLGGSFQVEGTAPPCTQCAAMSQSCIHHVRAHHPGACCFVLHSSCTGTCTPQSGV